MAISVDSQTEIQQLEIELLFEAIYRYYGYDFRNYAGGSATRRVLRQVEREQVDSVSMLQHRVLYDKSVAESLFRALSINITEMFRDPVFYQTIRKQVLAKLETWSHLKVWHAGCASGEEVYSMAILLSEENLYQRSQIYATDFNQVVLDTAKTGIYPLDRMQLYHRNYIAAGGTQSFSDYYHAKYERAIMDEKLKQSVLFAHHNLASDSSFGEMQMIICRNVLIYFNRDLQERVFQLFTDSLCINGFLCLGSHETINMSDLKHRYEVVDEKQKIYRKKN